MMGIKLGNFKCDLFEAQFWLKLCNLRLILGLTFKFNISVAKGLKNKSQKVWTTRFYV